MVNGKKAFFRPVETGISGVTDIEITKGLQSGDEIVVGSYKALRTLKPEASVKVDNSAPKKMDESAISVQVNRERTCPLKRQRRIRIARIWWTPGLLSAPRA